MNNKKVYAEKILDAIPRLLSSQDRDPTSPLYGSFDREYWAWATKDFSNIDLQRAVYPLALLWSNNFSENTYYKNEKLLEWIKAGMKFWCKSQHDDGSFDHLYINEHSFVGVAFTLYEIGEAYMIIKDRLDENENRRILVSIKKAADFLVKHDEVHGFISNHRAGTACALHIAYRITSEEKYLKEAKKYIETIAEKQSPEGWFNEYGGPDPGYQTLGTFYLSCYHGMTKDEKVLGMLRKSLEFLAYFVHPNGTIGGEYGSRNTEIYFPSGFEYLSDKISQASAIAKRMRESISKGAVNLNELDIRNFVPFFTSYVLAFLEKSKPIRNAKLPYEKEFEKYFDQAQIFVKSTDRYYAIIGISKGGVIRVYDKKKKKLVYSECGYSGKLKNGKNISNQMLDYKKNVITGGGIVKFDSRFYEVPFRVMTPRRFFLFRIFNLTLGRSYWMNNVVRNKFIVRGFITPKKPVKIRLRREFVLLPDSIKINDIFYPEGFNVIEMKKVEKFTTVFMATSKYYQKQEVENSLISGSDISQQINAGNEFTNSFSLAI